MKKMVALLLALLMVFSVTACGSKEASNGAQADASIEDSKQEAENNSNEVAAGSDSVLKIAAFEGGYGVDYWERISEEFEKAYNCKVELTCSPTIEDVVRPQIIAGDYPDILFTGDPNKPFHLELVKEQAWEPLNDVFDMPAYDGEGTVGDLIAPGLLDTKIFKAYRDDTIIQAPVSSYACFMVYNKTLFEENGWELPETWDEFFALGDAAAEKGYALLTYPGIYPDYTACMVDGSLASALGLKALEDYYDYDTSVLETPEAKEIFNNFAKAVSDQYLMEGTVGLNHTQSQSEFMLNKALFIPNGDWIVGEMADAPIADGFKWAAMPTLSLNKGDDRYYQFGADCFGIPKGAKNKDLAKEFVRFFYSDTAQLILNDCGMIPCTVNFADIVDGLDESVISFLKVREQGNAFIYGFTPVDSKINLYDYLYTNINLVATGDMTADEWREGIIDAFNRIKAGE